MVLRIDRPRFNRRERPGAPDEREKPTVAWLKLRLVNLLAAVPIGHEPCFPERAVGLESELRRLDQRREERSLIAFRQLWRLADGRHRDAEHPVGGQMTWERERDLRLVLLEERAEVRRFLRSFRQLLGHGDLSVLWLV